MMIEKLLTAFSANNYLALQPQSSLAIATLAMEQKQKVTILNFLSLCGTQAELPLYFSLWCLQNSYMLRLVCIFNQAFYRLYCQLLLSLHPILSKPQFVFLLSQSLALPRAKQSCLQLGAKHFTFASCASFHRLMQRLYGAYYSIEENQPFWHSIKNVTRISCVTELEKVTLGPRLCSYQYSLRINIFHPRCQWRLLLKLCQHLLAGKKIEIVHYRKTVLLKQAKLGKVKLISPRQQALK